MDKNGTCEQCKKSIEWDLLMTLFPRFQTLFTCIIFPFFLFASSPSILLGIFSSLITILPISLVRSSVSSCSFYVLFFLILLFALLLFHLLFFFSLLLFHLFFFSLFPLFLFYLFSLFPLIYNVFIVSCAICKP